MKPHEEWLFKAEQDLKSAEYLLSSPGKLFDAAIYHTQQCAEKALKAYLTKIELPIEKSHNLIYLCQIAQATEADFIGLLDAVIILNPYSIMFRYPEGDLLPTLTELQQAIDAARHVLQFVQKKILP